MVGCSSKATHLRRLLARLEASPKPRRGQRSLGEGPGLERRVRRDSPSSPPSAGTGCGASLEKEGEMLQELGGMGGSQPGFQPHSGAPTGITGGGWRVAAARHPPERDCPALLLAGENESGDQ